MTVDSTGLLVQAVIEAANEMPSLAKTSFNQHANYSYASIDDFYQVISPIMRKHGLTMLVSETAPAALLTDKVMLFSFSIELLHYSGGRYCVGMSVPHHLQGAQTAGSAQSYAVKCFLRSTFGLATGEADADAYGNDGQSPPTHAVAYTHTSSPGSIQPQPGVVLRLNVAPQETPPSAPSLGGDSSEGVTEGELQTILHHREQDNLPVLIEPDGPGYPWGLAHDVFLHFLPHVHDVKRMMEWWRLNMSVMDAMKIAEPAMHKSVKERFEDRRRQISEGAVQ